MLRVQLLFKRKYDIRRHYLQVLNAAGVAQW
jgi:hypothetical protein